MCIYRNISQDRFSRYHSRDVFIYQTRTYPVPCLQLLDGFVDSRLKDPATSNCLYYLAQREELGEDPMSRFRLSFEFRRATERED